MNAHDHTSPERLAAYFDGVLAPRERTEADRHVAHCADCLARLADMQRVRQVAAALPEPAVPDDLWDRIEGALTEELRPGQEVPGARGPGVQNTLRFGMLTTGLAALWAVAAVVLVAVTVGVLLAVRPFDSTPRGAGAVEEETAGAFGFDYGLYLTALTEPAHTQQFDDAYDRQQLSLQEALTATHVPVEPDLLTRLPAGLDLEAVYVLSNASAQSVQVTYRHGDQEITVFRQPRGHPVQFAGYRIEPVTVQGKRCLMVEGGRYCAVTFATADAQYVVVGRSDDQMVARVIDDLITRS